MKAFSFCLTKVQKQSGKKSILRLKESVLCFSIASNSAILSITHFLLSHFPQYLPPSIEHPNKDARQYSKLTKRGKSYNPFQQPWNSYLIHLVSKGHSACLHRCFYIIIPVSEFPIQGKENQMFELVNKTDNLKQIIDLQQQIKDVFNISFESRKNKTVGIFQYRPTHTNIFEPKINPVGLIMGNLFNNQTWHVIKTGDGQILTANQLSAFDYLILPGSIYSVFDLPSHLKNLGESILQACKNNDKLKVIGICFGHQLICTALGARCQKKTRIGGIQKVEFNSKIISNYPFFQELSCTPSIYISEHHQDFVMTIPDGFILLAKSRSCDVESLISKDGRILTVQFHSEYYSAFTKFFEKRTKQYYGMNTLDKFYVKEQIQAEEKNHQHSHIFLEVFRKFISS